MGVGSRRGSAAGERRAGRGAAPCDPFGPPAFRGEVPTPKQVIGIDLGERDVTTAESDAYLAAVDARLPARDRGALGHVGPGPRRCATRSSGSPDA